MGFRINPGLGTIDVTGFNLASSQKFRNVRRNGQAAFVVDDIMSTDPWRVRFLEIRGRAEALDDDTDDGASGGGADAGPGGGPLIRIHPVRILSFGVEEPPGEPHQTRLHTRDLPG